MVGFSLFATTYRSTLRPTHPASYPVGAGSPYQRSKIPYEEEKDVNLNLIYFRYNQD
jgi:hypothetical protein